MAAVSSTSTPAHAPSKKLSQQQRRSSRAARAHRCCGSIRDARKVSQTRSSQHPVTQAKREVTDDREVEELDTLRNSVEIPDEKADQEREGKNEAQPVSPSSCSSTSSADSTDSTGCSASELSEDDEDVGALAEAEAEDVVEVVATGIESTAEIPQISERRRVQFDMEAISVHEILAYSEIYGIHPRFFDFDKNFWMVPAVGIPNLSARYDDEDYENDSDSDSEDGEWEAYTTFEESCQETSNYSSAILIE
eukprot:TRINITY_DN72265_c0_g1_i1.p1 TRINITY_DN72265_c0_g1~~TRINITY_DN72265_c0_g1_i1.p1  ORF type:complete len:270 (+),score=53.20 TRINITY_DN72265_c0_g1_i1:58-810(+)